MKFLAPQGLYGTEYKTNLLRKDRFRLRSIQPIDSMCKFLEEFFVAFMSKKLF
jgi:hypothetical protein